jgi:SAM-dependent methyltransferase
MSQLDRERLRETFGEDASRYDRCRPSYPTALFNELATIVPPDPQTRVLEIGCGTGQATVPMARIGYPITAVELSGDMAAIARHHLAGFPATQVVVSAFEDLPLPTDTFDLVFAATAFHWLDPEVRMTKVANILRPEGSLALISTHHVAGGTEPFFDEVQRCYERFDPDVPPDMRLPVADEVPMDSTEFDQSALFGSVQFRRYEWERTYTTNEYQDLLLTYSGHRVMPESCRDKLLACIGELIDNSFDGQITKRYLTQLATARCLT